MGLAEWLSRKWSDEEYYLGELVKKSRPEPIRQVDQIYMRLESMIIQTRLMANEIANKKVVFIGDGDSMSLMFGLYAIQGKIPAPEHMFVLDFDKRILRNISEFSKKYGFGHLITVELYNVKWKVPQSLKDWEADYFYTNPAYSSKTEPPGKAITVFIDRALNMCAPGCSGCIILPYDRTRPWTQEVNKTVQDYFKEVGLCIREMISDLHSYHLDDDPNLRSGIVIVDKVEFLETKYKGKEIPARELVCFYGGSNDPVPEYVDEDGAVVCKEYQTKLEL